MTTKNEQEIEFLKQFKNPVVKLFAWLFRYRKVEVLIIIIAILITIIIVGEKDFIMNIPIIKNFFGGK